MGEHDNGTGDFCVAGCDCAACESERIEAAAHDEMLTYELLLAEWAEDDRRENERGAR